MFGLIACNGKPVSVVNKGADGGLQGAQGTSSLEGIQGPMGPQGPAGPAGATGPQGQQGIPGNQGIPGVAGLPGIQGSTGLTGAQGPRGDKGDDGEGWTLVQSVELTNAANQTFNGLNGDRDGRYRITLNGVVVTSGNDARTLEFRMNGVASGYRSNSLTWSPAGWFNASSTTGLVFTRNGWACDEHWIGEYFIHARSGKPRSGNGILHAGYRVGPSGGCSNGDNNATHIGAMIGGAWEENTTNITSIVMVWSSPAVYTGNVSLYAYHE